MKPLDLFARGDAAHPAAGAVAVPSPAACLALMAEFGMLAHIREHSLLVQEVACTLGRELMAVGHELDLDLIAAGALLHDLGKTPCLGTDQDHALWGAAVLTARGYPAVAQVVAEHVRVNQDGTDPRPLREAEVVNYADKRVLHTRVVSLTARFADLKRRYGRTAAILSRIQANEEISFRLEAKIFASLSITPDDLMHLNQRRRPWQSSSSP